VRARIGDIDVGFDERGTGPALVFIHGFPHDRRLWSAQLSALADRARCIVPDLRGFGASTAAPPFSMDQYADDIAGLMPAIGVERAVIAGLSMGGYIAMALWRRHPSLVRAFAFLDTRAGADTDEGRAKRREHIALVRERGSEALATLLIEQQLGETTRARNAPAVEAVRRMLSQAPVEGVVGALEAMMARPDSSPTLPTIAVPTLIVVGGEDTVTPPAQSRLMHEAIRGSRLEVIEGSGHLTCVERPGAVNHLLAELLDELM
jgi:pimeloyl-ACP methyl ester carboxylesterase